MSLVSCIMPTYNRRAFVPHAIRYFLRQDYRQKELIIIDDGSDNINDLIPVNNSIRYYRLEKKITLGAKLNLACTYASGDIIVNWDDDDWYAERRLSYQVDAIQQEGIEVCGINTLFYYDIKNRLGYQYVYPASQRVWLLGSSLCFTRKLWLKNPFADINVGMDGLFVWAADSRQVKVLEDHTFSVHMIHAENVSPKNTKGGYWNTYPVERLRQIMDADWNYYINDGFYDNVKSTSENKPVQFSSTPNQYRLLNNVYVCLVHENEDCIVDLVRNLNYLDPASVILLYNGSNNQRLLTQHSLYQKYNAVIHPDPVPQKHGYLHKFALACMEYALENFSFDTFTIVDSDQLLIRKGYCDYLSKFFASSPKAGMLSSMPDRVLGDDKVNLVAAQAFKEYNLWKPFLKSFPNGESNFVYWTFWPSTVFTCAAIRSLVNLFKENLQLQHIMEHTKIWATEEVIFPTLVRLLGYEIAKNPCSYDFVKYRKNYTTQEVNDALNTSNAYWIHPVERSFTNSLRAYTRRIFNDYGTFEPAAAAAVPALHTHTSDTALIKKIKTINGWLTDNEAKLLIEYTHKVCTTSAHKNNIVEIGSYHGKCTILFGTILKSYARRGKLFAIDTHDGKLGAEDQGLKIFPPSYEIFKKNIANAPMAGVAEIIKDKACNVKWEVPVSFLFIDGLHDYVNVAADFYHFSDWIEIGGYVAFHDYADYFPGVKKLVHEILLTAAYKKVQQADSLIILQRINESYTVN